MKQIAQLTSAWLHKTCEHPTYAETIPPALLNRTNLFFAKKDRTIYFIHDNTPLAVHQNHAGKIKIKGSFVTTILQQNPELRSHITTSLKETNSTTIEIDLNKYPQLFAFSLDGKIPLKRKIKDKGTKIKATTPNPKFIAFCKKLFAVASTSLPT